MQELLLAAFLLGLFIVVPIVALARVTNLRRELRRLAERLERLERTTGAPPDLAAVPPPAAMPMTPPAPLPFPGLAAAEPPSAALAPPAPAPIVMPAPAVAPAPRPRRDMEQVVGGVWLQNAGSVVVLVGVFFLILWGWTTGRFGPGVLIASGVLLGFGIAWRGDRTSRTLPDIGHALIGVGLGVVYLALYLGHFTLHVLGTPVAFAALLGASALTVLAGLRYRVQTIATLGVIGAFLPQMLAGLVPLQGFSLPPAALLGYLAAVDALVFVLAARAGWSLLALAAVVLTAGTWIGCVHAPEWSWPLEIGLAAMFAALGLAPLPQLARSEGAARPQDLALIGATPLALIACSWPMWAIARPVPVAMLLLSLAALYLGASLWVDARRPERDLWRPLTGAATVFLTAALQRAVGTENTPLAWTVEGAVLVTLGLGPRGGWIRLCGHVVAALGGLWLLANLLEVFQAPGIALPLWNANSARDGVAIAALLIAGFRLYAAREHLAPAERAMPYLWLGVANLLVMLWTRREAHHVAWVLEGRGGVWRHLPSVEAAPGLMRQAQLFLAVCALAWIAQAALLLRASVTMSWRFLRACGSVAGGAAALVLIAAILEPDGWGRDLLPVLNRDSLLLLAGALALGTIAVRLAATRGTLGFAERYTPEFWTAGAALVSLMWIAREADHVARAALDVPGAHSTAWSDIAAGSRSKLDSLTPTLTSVGWLLQAIGTLAFGWWRRSPFLRWTGLGLVGLVALKVLIMDLSHADPFWRFLAAIAVGVAMLAVSYAYQRRKKLEAAGPEA